MRLNEQNLRHLVHRQCLSCVELYLSSFDPVSELSVYAGFETVVEDRPEHVQIRGRTTQSDRVSDIACSNVEHVHGATKDGNSVSDTS